MAEETEFEFICRRTREHLEVLRQREIPPFPGYTLLGYAARNRTIFGIDEAQAIANQRFSAQAYQQNAYADSLKEILAAAQLRNRKP